MGIVTMLVPLALSRLLAQCAPNVGPVTMSAIVVHESGARPNAIGDNTTRRSYDFADRASAVATAARLLQRGDNIDVGYAQVNSGNFAAYGLDAASAFDPCTNVSVGSRILRGNYAAAARAYGPGQVALVHALSAYNTGGYFSGLAYARAVYATAGSLHDNEVRPDAAHRRAVQFVRAGGRRAVAFHPSHARGR